MLNFVFRPTAYLSLFLLLAIATAACQPKAATPQTQASRIVSEPVTEATSFVLIGEGIEVVDNQTGELKPLQFGSAGEQVSNAVTAAIGEPEETISAQGKCPESTVWPTGFAINNQGKFVGWSLKEDAEASRIKLLEGISVGSTLAELEEHYRITVLENSLETEFSTADGFSGIADSEESNGMITHLWSGDICISRR